MTRHNVRIQNASASKPPGCVVSSSVFVFALNGSQAPKRSIGGEPGDR
jgi:hypothetical protein